MSGFTEVPSPERVKEILADGAPVADLKSAVKSVKEAVKTPPPLPAVVGIQLIQTEHFNGFVCQCKNMHQKTFTKFMSKTLSKDAKGRWKEGEKLYLMCGKCKKKTEITKEINVHMIINAGKRKEVKPIKHKPDPTKKQVLSKKTQRKREKKNRKAGRSNKM